MMRWTESIVIGVAGIACASCAGSCKRSEVAAPVPAEARIVVTGRRYQVGFGADVQLEAKVEPDGGVPWKITWARVWGTPPEGMTQQESGSLRFRTCAPPSREAAAAHASHPVPLSSAEACRVVFRVVASSGGSELTDHVEVIPAFPTASWTRVAVGLETYWYLPSDQPWSVEKGRFGIGPGPVPWLGRARAMETQWVDLAHPSAGPTRVRAGAWVGSQDCGRYDCHPSEYLGWKQTSHASVLERALRGTLPDTHGEYREDCLHCHALGYQPTIRNDGFSERAVNLRWRMPERTGADLWENLPAGLKARANVQCEHCHGPGWFWTGYTNDVCAQCHDQPPRYLTVSQSKRNAMIDTSRRVADAPKDQVCAGCHVARAFLSSLRGHDSASKPVLELQPAGEGVTCAACHDPHGRACPKQLRFCGPIEVPGLTFPAGQGAICIACHDGESDVFRGPLLRPFRPGHPDPNRKGHGGGSAPDATYPDAAPHAPQMQVLSGRGGRFLSLPERFGPSPVYPHLFVPDSCVGCHYQKSGQDQVHGGHTFRLAEAAAAATQAECPPKPHFDRIRDATMTASCARCHGTLRNLDRAASGDYDGDREVEGIVREVDGLASALREELVRQFEVSRPAGARGESRGFTVAGERMVYAGEGCKPLLDAQGNAIPIAPEEPLGKAAFNYLLVIRDGSAGIHNPKYVVKLLQNTLEELEKRRGVKASRTWKREE